MVDSQAVRVRPCTPLFRSRIEMRIQNPRETDSRLRYLPTSPRAKRAQVINARNHSEPFGSASKVHNDCPRSRGSLKYATPQIISLTVSIFFCLSSAQRCSIVRLDKHYTELSKSDTPRGWAPQAHTSLSPNEHLRST